MKRNSTKKVVRKTVTAQKNEKTRKGFRTGVKAGGRGCGLCYR